MSLADRRAALLRADYEDWAARYQPLEQELLGLYNNPGALASAQSQAVSSFDQNFDTAAGAYDRRLAGYGIQLTPEQQQARDRSLEFNKGLGEVDAMNRTARAIDDRDQLIATGAGSARNRWSG